MRQGNPANGRSMNNTTSMSPVNMYQYPMPKLSENMVIQNDDDEFWDSIGPSTSIKQGIGIR